MNYTSQNQDEILFAGQRWWRWMFNPPIAKTGGCESLTTLDLPQCAAEDMTAPETVLEAILLDPRLPPCEPDPPPDRLEPPSISLELRAVDGSTRIGRAGHYSELRLKLVNRIERSVAGPHGLRSKVIDEEVLVGAPVGVSPIVLGPSRGRQAVCINLFRSGPRPPSVKAACVTNDLGEIIVRYQIPFNNLNLFAMQHDTIQVYVDNNRNGRFDNDRVHGVHSDTPARAFRPDYFACRQGHKLRRAG